MPTMKRETMEGLRYCFFSALAHMDVCVAEKKKHRQRQHTLLRERSGGPRPYRLSQNQVSLMLLPGCNGESPSVKFREKMWVSVRWQTANAATSLNILSLFWKVKVGDSEGIKRLRSWKHK